MFKCLLSEKADVNEDFLKISDFIELVFVKEGRQVRGQRQATHRYLPTAWNDV